MTVAGNRAAEVTLPADTQIAEAVTTLTLTETSGGTTLTLLVQHASQENRDRHLEYGDSLQQAMDRLEQAAISLR